MPVATYNAIVSGRAGLALLVKGDQTLALRAGEAEPTPVPISSYHHLLGESQDLEFQQAAPLERVSEQLSLAVRREQALDCVLTLLSDRYPDELRQLAAEELTPELEHEPVRTALEGVMYAAPLPDSADLVRAKDLTVRVFSQVNGWLTRLGELQPIIGAVRRAWSEIEFEANDARQEIEAACVRAGAFREFVAAAEQRQNVATEVVQLLQHPVLRARVAQVDLRRVFGDWQSALKEGGVVSKPVEREIDPESEDEDA